jgi:hypothetical protein
MFGEKINVGEYILKESVDLEYLHIRIPVREVPTPNLNNGDNRRAYENSS